MISSTTKLFLFDADGTLCDRDSQELLPNTMQRIRQIPTDAKIAICTNQGGVGLRVWMEVGGFGEPEKYPTQEDVLLAYEDLTEIVGAHALYISYRYQSRESKVWSKLPEGLSDYDKSTCWSKLWRKPGRGMLTQAMIDFDVEPDQVTFVGDSIEDEEAAKNAGVHFVHADDFFGRREFDAESFDKAYNS